MRDPVFTVKHGLLCCNVGSLVVFMCANILLFVFVFFFCFSKKHYYNRYKSAAFETVDTIRYSVTDQGEHGCCPGVQ